jgi:hypothetical protein
MNATKGTYIQAAEALEKAFFCGYVAGYKRANPDANMSEALNEYVTDFDSDTPTETLRSWWYRFRKAVSKGEKV